MFSLALKTYTMTVQLEIMAERHGSCPTLHRSWFSVRSCIRLLDALMFVRPVRVGIIIICNRLHDAPCGKIKLAEFSQPGKYPNASGWWPNGHIQLPSPLAI